MRVTNSGRPMSSGYGELEYHREAFANDLPHLCTTLRKTAGSQNPNPGDPVDSSYIIHLVDVPCWYVETGQVETERGLRRVTARTATIIVPWGTDVLSSDLIQTVRGDLEPNGTRDTLNSSRLSILGVHRLDDHYELEVEELS